MKLAILVVFSLLLSVVPVRAQFSAQRDAMYIATLKAVTDYKINDEENIRDIEALRENRRFNKELSVMLSKLSNNRNKNSVNNRVYRILLKAGKEIYNELN